MHLVAVLRKLPSLRMVELRYTSSLVRGERLSSLPQTCRSVVLRNCDTDGSALLACRVLLLSGITLHVELLPC